MVYELPTYRRTVKETRASVTTAAEGVTSASLALAQIDQWKQRKAFFEATGLRVNDDGTVRAQRQTRTTK